MLSTIHCALLLTTIVLIGLAMRRAMVSHVTLLSVLVLVGTIAVMTVNNKMLNAKLVEQERLSFRTLNEHSENLEKCMRDIRIKGNEINEANIKIQKVSAEGQTLSHENAGLKEKLEAALQLSARITELQNTLTVVTQEKDSLQSQLQGASQQVNALTAERDDIQNRLNEAQGQLYNAQQQAQRVGDLEARLGETEAQLNLVNEAAANANARLQDVTHQLAQTQEHLRNADARAAAAEQQAAQANQAAQAAQANQAAPAGQPA